MSFRSWWYKSLQLLEVRGDFKEKVDVQVCAAKKWGAAQVIAGNSGMILLQAPAVIEKIRIAEHQVVFRPDLLADLDRTKLCWRAKPGLKAKLIFDADMKIGLFNVISTGKWQSLLQYALPHSWRHVSLKLTTEEFEGPLQSVWLPPKEPFVIDLQFTYDDHHYVTLQCDFPCNLPISIEIHKQCRSSSYPDSYENFTFISGKSQTSLVQLKKYLAWDRLSFQVPYGFEVTSNLEQKNSSMLLFVEKRPSTYKQPWKGVGEMYRDKSSSLAQKPLFSCPDRFSEDKWAQFCLLQPVVAARLAKSKPLDCMEYVVDRDLLRWSPRVLHLLLTKEDNSGV